MKIKYEIQLSSKMGTHLDGKKALLYYCVIRKDDEHLYTQQTTTPERAYLLALQLLSKELIDLELPVEGGDDE